METYFSNLNGKIWLFFDAMIEWELIIETDQQVTAKLFHHDIGQHIMMTFVYAKYSSLEKLELWDHMYYMATDMELPWLVGRYFNVTLNEDEKIGDYQYILLNMRNLHSVSTHVGCLIKAIRGVHSHGRMENQMFNAEHTSFKELVRQNWYADFMGDPFLLFKHKLKKVKGYLSKWIKVTFGDILKQLTILEDIVKVKEMLFEEESTIDNRLVLQAKLKKYLSLEEQYWKQKAWMAWYAEGDRNTSFFHNYVNEGDAADYSLLDIVLTIVTMDQNLELCRYPTLEEVKNVVFELSDNSASGPNGFIGLFYQEFWDVICMSRFFKGRSIFENILLTQKIVTDIRMKGKPVNIVIKLDMAKAYDRVFWKYLLHVLGRMGFAEHFINMLWNLISNNWYSVLVNGQSPGFFKSTRGVKQGDPLSPALFVLSVEVLSRCVNKLFDNTTFKGFGMPKWTDPLNHLAYADDTIIFASAHPPSLKKIMAVLGGYD
ncbi:uncharacterized protein LOC142178185 [Nicotiana tabacum]|uniref:Uncharacterized protein LOC142178185 n=1 Tax=Nicotiana tabacum TaxID=4097 RepID=A0AC58U2D0_TOBAC